MSKNEIFICFNCGTKNRVPTKQLPLAKCGKCKKPLLDNETTSAFTASTQSHHSPLKNTVGAKRNQSPLRKIILLATVVIGLGYLIFPKERSQSSRPDIATSLPPIVAQSTGIIWNNTGKVGNAPFRIVTNPGNNYYIKLVDYNSGADMLGIFAHGGRTLEVTVPTGSYRLRYAYGEGWRGLNALFGPGRHTTYQEALTRFDFSEKKGFTVKLVKQPRGNMRTTSIGANQF